MMTMPSVLSYGRHWIGKLVHIFSPRLAKTIPFVILLSNARQNYSSRESRSVEKEYVSNRAIYYSTHFTSEELYAINIILPELKTQPQQWPYKHQCGLVGFHCLRV